MRTHPVIGITSDLRVEKRTLGFVFTEYVDRVTAAGGTPLQIPPLDDPSLVPRILDVLDGVVIVGGEDIDPSLYGETPLATHRAAPARRLAFDVALVRAILERRTPVLGVCYGCQLLAVVAGGALVQHIPSQIEDPVRHAGSFPDLPVHPIRIASGTRLASIFDANVATVNSAHHQAPKRVASDWVVSATAPDGVIEAFEAPGDRFLVGVEWHPELMDDDAHRRLFGALVEAARNA